MAAIPTPSFLVAAMKTSVLMNGIVVPFSRCAINLQRFCRPSAFHNDHELYNIGLSGSCFLLRHRNRNVLLHSKHQLGEGEHQRKPEEIMIILEDSDGNKSGLTPNAVRKIAFPDDETHSLEDVLLVEYAAYRDKRALNRYFYDLDLDAVGDLRSVNPKQIILIFAIRYPSKFSSFETEYDEEYQPTGLDITSRWSKIYLELTEPNAWDKPYRLPLKLHSEFKQDIRDPDGFSGSPVFFIYQDSSRQTHLGYAGMITHANKEGRFNIYEGSRVRDLVNRLPLEPAIESD